MPVCPNCKRRLSKEDVMRQDEWDYTTDNPRLVKKSLLCMNCGFVLIEKDV